MNNEKIMKNIRDFKSLDVKSLNIGQLIIVSIAAQNMHMDAERERWDRERLNKEG